MDIVPGGGDFGGAGAGAESIGVMLSPEVLNVANDAEKLAALVVNNEEGFSLGNVSIDDVVDIDTTPTQEIVAESSPATISETIDVVATEQGVEKVVENTSPDIVVGTGTDTFFDPNALPTSEVVAESIPGSVVAPIEATIEKGGSLWKAGKTLVSEGKITQEQFAQAWSNVNSVHTLESGTSVHISELGLVHPGDQLVYVAEHNGVPAHFQVVDTADALHVGTNADLAEAFDRAGKPRPAWLVKALETQTAVMENVDTLVESATEAADSATAEAVASSVGDVNDIVVGMGVETSLAGESIQAGFDTEGGVEDTSSQNGPRVELVPGEMYAFPWGRVSFFVDDEGRARDIFINDRLNPRQKIVAVREALKELTNPGYGDVLEIPRGHSATASFDHQAMRGSQYLEVLKKIPSRSSEAIFLRERVADFLSLSWIPEESRPRPDEVFKKGLLARFRVPTL